MSVNKILFVTNRNRLPDTDGIADFGAQAGPSALGLAFGVAEVAGVTLEQPSDGTITRAEVVNFGGIGPELTAEIPSDADILVFVHGAANSFRDSVRRAAFNQSWMNAAPGQPQAVIVFSWPATSYTFVDLLADLRDYRHDQAQAQASAGDFVGFLRALFRWRATFGQRRISLLAHSMGNYALAFGIEAWFAQPRDPIQLFDAVVLAAADETSTTFDRPDGARLSDLFDIGRTIAVYSNREDVLMAASLIANREWQLGHDGPPNRADATFFPASVYTFIDATGNEDYTNSFADAPDRSHQYYRQSRSIRTDIARVLRGQAAPAGARNYDRQRNVYTVALGQPALV